MFARPRLSAARVRRRRRLLGPAACDVVRIRWASLPCATDKGATAGLAVGRDRYFIEERQSNGRAADHQNCTGSSDMRLLAESELNQRSVNRGRHTDDDERDIADLAGRSHEQDETLGPPFSTDEVRCNFESGANGGRSRGCLDGADAPVRHFVTNE